MEADVSEDILYAGQCSSNRKKKKSKYSEQLNFLVAQKMVWKFLSIDRIEIQEVKVVRYTKTELAVKLGITVEELDKARKSYFYKNIASKISLPLVELYCSTKWVNDNNAKQYLQ